MNSKIRFWSGIFGVLFLIWAIGAAMAGSDLFGKICLGIAMVCGLVRWASN